MTYTVADRGSGLPIKNWAGDLDAKTQQQADNLAALPCAFHHVGLMPDAHAGYGMPIGGVLATTEAVVPYAIGVDIGCGVILANLGIKADALLSSSKGSFGQILKHIASNVPTGFGSHTLAFTRARAVELIEEAPPSGVKSEWFDRSLSQLGTLGGGNHFIEFQRDEEDNAYVMLHSGSRGLGKAICDFYHKAALAQNIRYHTPLPDKELAFIPQGEPLFKQYFDSMRFAMAWAETNRRLMLEQALTAVSIAVEEWEGAEVVAECHHNYAAFENHFGRNVVVHRKGAVRARGGDLVLIPGSMGTASYVAEGLGSPDSFMSSQHGAGRAKSRTAMHREMTSDDVYGVMADAGIVLVSSSPADAMEEAPSAYKDVEDVMSRSTDLVRPLKRLTPVGVVKG